MPPHIPAASSGALLVTLMDANNAPMGKANVYISQLSVTIKNGPTSPAYTQTMNDYRSSWVSSERPVHPASSAGQMLLQHGMACGRNAVDKRA